MMKFLIACMLLYSSVTFGEKIMFNYGSSDDPRNQQAEIAGIALIDSDTGDILVTPVDDLLIIKSQYGIIRLNSDSYIIDEGDSVNISWESALVIDDSCLASVEYGSIEDNLWNGTISNSGEQTVYPETMPVKLDIECTNLSVNSSGINEKSMNSIVIDKIPESSGPTASVQFFVDDESLTSPRKVELSWIVTGVNSCKLFSKIGLSGYQLIKSIADPLTEKLYETAVLNETTDFKLSCGTIEKVLRVTVSTLPPVEGCTDVAFPEGLSHDDRIYSDVKNANFGTVTDGKVELNTKVDEFTSLYFEMPANLRRKLTFAPIHGGQYLAEHTTFTISSCPGDFVLNGHNGSMSDECHISKPFLSLSEGLNMRISSKTSDDNDSNFCHLTPGGKYYINVVHMADPADSQSSPVCSGSNPNDVPTECGIQFKEDALQ